MSSPQLQGIVYKVVLWQVYSCTKARVIKYNCTVLVHDRYQQSFMNTKRCIHILILSYRFSLFKAGSNGSSKIINLMFELIHSLVQLYQTNYSKLITKPLP